MMARWGGEFIHCLTMPGGAAVGARPQAMFSPVREAFEVAGDAGVPGLGGAVMVEEAAAQHVGRMGAGGVAQLCVGAQWREVVLGADLVEQDDDLLLAGRAEVTLGRGLADGRDDADGED